MARVSGGLGLDLPALRQQVRIGGAVRTDVFCTTVSRSSSGCDAQFSAPAMAWDRKRSLLGKRVSVDVWYDGAPGASVRLFNGLVSAPAGEARGGRVTFGARSPLALADTVYLGQDVELRAEYPASGGWTASEIVRDWFGSSAPSSRGGGGSIPSQWRAFLKLGDVGALRRSYNTFALGDVELHRASLAEGLERIAGLLGTVAWRERFVGDDTYLDLYEVGVGGGAATRIRVAREGESIEGSAVLELAHTMELPDLRDRAICVGDVRLRTVTLWSDRGSVRLAPAWSASLEAAVLADPEIAVKGPRNAAGPLTSAQQEAYLHVFRRFRIPAEWRRRNVLRPEVVLPNGERAPAQVLTIRRRPVLVEGEWIGQAESVPSILDGATVDVGTGYVTLREPAVGLLESVLVSGPDGPEEQDTNVALPVAVSLSIESGRLKSDTGATGNPAEVIGGAGLASAFLQDSFGDEGVGTSELPECWVWDAEGSTWRNYLAPTVLRTDEATVAALAQAAAAEARRPRESYNVTMPYVMTGLVPGSRVRLVGVDDWDGGVHQVETVTHDLTHAYRTQIQTSNGAPRVASSLLEGGV